MTKQINNPNNPSGVADAVMIIFAFLCVIIIICATLYNIYHNQQLCEQNGFDGYMPNEQCCANKVVECTKFELQTNTCNLNNTIKTLRCAQ